MRRSLWTVALAALMFGGLGMVGGTAVGGSIGPVAAAYGVFLTLTALYLIAVLAIRERAVRGAHHASGGIDRSDRLAGRRIF